MEIHVIWETSETGIQQNPAQSELIAPEKPSQTEYLIPSWRAGTVNPRPVHSGEWRQAAGKRPCKRNASTLDQRAPSVSNATRDFRPFAKDALHGNTTVFYRVVAELGARSSIDRISAPV